MADAERTLAIVLKALGVSQTAAGIGRVSGSMRGLERQGHLTSRGLSNVARNLSRVGVAGAALAVGGLAASVNVAADFEAELRTINTVADVNDQQLQRIGTGIRRLARETGQPLEELTKGYYDLVSAGIAAGHAQDVLDASTRLAVGGLATASESVDLLTTAINAYGGDATRAGEYADYFAKAIERGKVTAADLAASFAQVAPLAAAMGIEIQELAAGYATLTAQGTPAAEASTQMRAAIVALQRPTTELRKMQKDLNINFAELAEQEGLVEAYRVMRIEAEKAGIPLIRLTGRVEGTQFALQTTGKNLDAFTSNMDAMGSATGTAARQMSERQQGLNFHVNRLKALARDAGIVVGNRLLPPITRLAEKASEWLDVGERTPEMTRRMARFGEETDTAGSRLDAWAAKLGTVFDDVMDQLDDVDWAAIGEGLKAGGVGARAIVDAFTSLPPWAQTFLATGFIANKFSGGILGQAIGAGLKGLVKGILGIQAGVVNVTGATVNGPGAPGAPGTGGPGGGGPQPGPVVTPAIGAGAFFNREMLPTFEQMNANLGIVRSAFQGGRVSTDVLASSDNILAELRDEQRAESSRGLVEQRHGEQTIAGLRSVGLAAQRAGERAFGGSMQAGLAAQRAGERVAGSIDRKDLSTTVNVGGTAVTTYFSVSGQLIAKAISSYFHRPVTIS